MKTCKKACELTKVCNPESGRCVLKTGRIGKKLLSLGKRPTYIPLTRKEIFALGFTSVNDFSNDDRIERVSGSSSLLRFVDAELLVGMMPNPGDSVTFYAVVYDPEEQWFDRFKAHRFSSWNDPKVPPITVSGGHKSIEEWAAYGNGWDDDALTDKVFAGPASDVILITDAHGGYVEAVYLPDMLGARPMDVHVRLGSSVDSMASAWVKKA